MAADAPVAAPTAPASLAHYRKFVMQLAAVLGSGMLVLVDTANHGGAITAVTWWLVLGAVAQAAGTYFPKSWWVKLGASAVGVIFSGVLAALTPDAATGQRFTLGEVLVVSWQILMWLASGAVDNAPHPLPESAGYAAAAAVPSPVTPSVTGWSPTGAGNYTSGQGFSIDVDPPHPGADGA
jgi:hypothetical protein